MRKRLLGRNLVSGAFAVVGLRIKLRCGKVSCSAKIFRMRFLMNKKRPHVCSFVDGHRTVSNELLVLCVVLQRHVGLEKAVDQFLLLVLGVYAAQTSR